MTQLSVQKFVLAGLVMWVIALEWLIASWGKFAKPEYLHNISATLQTFADRGQYEFYNTLLDSYVIPNATLFGQLSRWGELATGIVLALGGMILILGKLKLSTGIIIFIALGAGFLMNLNFYLASSWSGPASQGLNLVMGLIQITLMWFILRLIKLTDRQ